MFFGVASRGSRDGRVRPAAHARGRARARGRRRRGPGGRARRASRASGIVIPRRPEPAAVGSRHPGRRRGGRRQAQGRGGEEARQGRRAGRVGRGDDPRVHRATARSALTVPHLSPSARSDAGLALGDALRRRRRDGDRRASRPAHARPRARGADARAPPPRACTKTPRRSSPTSRAGASAKAAESRGTTRTRGRTRRSRRPPRRRTRSRRAATSPRSREKTTTKTASWTPWRERWTRTSPRLTSRRARRVCDVRSKNAAAADALAGLWNLADARVMLAEAIAARPHGGFGHGGHDQNHDQNRCQKPKPKPKRREGGDVVLRRLRRVRTRVRSMRLARRRRPRGLAHGLGRGPRLARAGAGGRGSVCDADVAVEALKRATPRSRSWRGRRSLGSVTSTRTSRSGRRTGRDLMCFAPWLVSCSSSDGNVAPGKSRSFDAIARRSSSPTPTPRWRGCPPGSPAPARVRDGARLDSRRLVPGGGISGVPRGTLAQSRSNRRRILRGTETFEAHFARGWATPESRWKVRCSSPTIACDFGWASDRLEMAYNAACVACLAGDLDAGERLLESVVEFEHDARSDRGGCRPRGVAIATDVRGGTVGGIGGERGRDRRLPLP